MPESLLFSTIREYIERGDLEGVKQFCTDGRLEQVQPGSWCHKDGEVYVYPGCGRERIFRYACAHGNVPIASYLSKHIELNIEDNLAPILCSIYESKSGFVLSEIMKLLNITPAMLKSSGTLDYAFLTAMGGGGYDLLRYLHLYCRITKDDLNEFPVMAWAVGADGDRMSLVYAHKNMGYHCDDNEFIKSAFRIARVYNRTWCLEYLDSVYRCECCNWPHNVL